MLAAALAPSPSTRPGSAGLPPGPALLRPPSAADQGRDVDLVPLVGADALVFLTGDVAVKVFVHEVIVERGWQGMAGEGIGNGGVEVAQARLGECRLGWVGGVSGDRLGRAVRCGSAVSPASAPRVQVPVLRGLMWALESRVPSLLAAAAQPHSVAAGKEADSGLGVGGAAQLPRPLAGGVLAVRLPAAPDWDEGSEAGGEEDGGEEDGPRETLLPYVVQTRLPVRNTDGRHI